MKEKELAVKEPNSIEKKTGFSKNDLHLQS